MKMHNFRFNACFIDSKTFFKNPVHSKTLKSIGEEKEKEDLGGKFWGQQAEIF
jgi:hypothetical protein